jgi:hypothetical protein
VPTAQPPLAQGTPEESVGWFCELARRSGDLFRAQQEQPVREKVAA